MGAASGGRSICSSVKITSSDLGSLTLFRLPHYKACSSTTARARARLSASRAAGGAHGKEQGVSSLVRGVPAHNTSTLAILQFRRNRQLVAPSYLHSFGFHTLKWIQAASKTLLDLIMESNPQVLKQRGQRSRIHSSSSAQQQRGRASSPFPELSTARENSRKSNATDVWARLAGVLPHAHAPLRLHEKKSHP